MNWSQVYAKHCILPLKIEQGHVGKILTNTIQAFLKCAPSWWLNARAVVARLESKEYDIPRALLLFACLRGLFALLRFEISDL
jgi:hypothetical protein